MYKKNIAFLMAMTFVAAFAACSNSNEQTGNVSEIISEASDIISESEAAKAETISETSLETTQSIELSSEIKIDENDETVIRGREFAESYAEMSWNYLCGAAWENYATIKYFDFDDKSEDNYFEKDGVPFYKLLITDYTYDEFMEYIKSFCTDEAFEKISDGHFTDFITEKDNCIFVNGNEPTFIYTHRNERAQIIGYTENSDGTVTYDCYAKTTEENDSDLYFSFTLNGENKLCGEFTDSEIRLFSTSMY